MNTHKKLVYIAKVSLTAECYTKQRVCDACVLHACYQVFMTKSIIQIVGRTPVGLLVSVRGQFNDIIHTG